MLFLVIFIIGKSRGNYPHSMAQHIDAPHMRYDKQNALLCFQPNIKKTMRNRPIILKHELAQWITMLAQDSKHKVTLYNECLMVQKQDPSNITHFPLLPLMYLQRNVLEDPSWATRDIKRAAGANLNSKVTNSSSVLSDPQLLELGMAT